MWTKKKKQFTSHMQKPEKRYTKNKLYNYFCKLDIATNSKPEGGSLRELASPPSVE
jgi:hypothetical protein